MSFDPNEKRDNRGRWTAERLRAEAARHGNNAIGNDLRKQADALEKDLSDNDLKKLTKTSPPSRGSFWAVHPTKGPIYIDNSHVDSHVEWFGGIGLPDWGTTFDNISRGQMGVDTKNKRITIFSYGHVPSSLTKALFKKYPGYRVFEVDSIEEVTW